MPRFQIWSDSEYVTVTQGSKYATIWLHRSDENVNMPEYVSTYNNKQVSEYSSCNV